MPKPTNRTKIIKKRTAPFLRQESERYKRLGNQHTWRKPKGIDSRMRRRFKGQRPLVKIGYRSDKRSRHLLPNHFYKFRVFNVNDLELLLMHNGKYAAQIAGSVSSRKRKEIIERAKQLDIKVMLMQCIIKVAPFINIYALCCRFSMPTLVSAPLNLNRLWICSINNVSKSMSYFLF